MIRENFLINPPKRLKRNPVGEVLITVGANPKHALSKRRKRVMRRRKFSNPLMYRGVIPSLGAKHYRYDLVSAKVAKRHASVFGKSKKKVKKHSVSGLHGVKVRRKHNPPLMADVRQFTGEVMNVRSWVPLAFTGAVSAMTGAVTPGLIGVVNPWVKYGVQTATALGGGMVVGKFIDKRHGDAWMATGVAMVGYQVLRDYVLRPYFPQFAVGLGGEAGEYNEYYPNDREDEVSQEVGAFPQGISAFPQGISDYPGVGGSVEAYPYDGAGY